MTTKRMSGTAVVVLAACFVVVAAGAAKDKKKTVLPAYVLRAETAVVLIDPEVGIPLNDAGGNRTAQDDVEKALMNWGRLHLVMDAGQADLVIVVRKGNKQVVQPTIGGVPTNDRPIIVQQTDSASRIGVQTGHPVDPSQPGQTGGPMPGGEVGPSEDMFSVYQGHSNNPTEGTYLWRYAAKDALRSPDVPAVGEFKKAVDEAVKQQQKQQQKQGQQQQTPQQQSTQQPPQQQQCKPN